MKRSLVTIFGFLVPLLAPLTAQQQDAGPEVPFDAVDIVSNMKMPAGIFLGEAAGVDVNSKGHIFVYSRTGDSGHILYRRSAQLFEFGPDGKFIREIGGRNVYTMGWAHSVRIDREDNIWTVDNGTNLVAKFDQQGRLLMTLGRRGESAGVYDNQLAPGEPSLPKGANPTGTGMFFEPTDVAFDAAGNIFVSDGYKNSRVQKFDKDGHFVRTWGTRGTGPGQFNIPHSIAVDARGNVYVADRSNHRIQVFDNDGAYLREWKLNIRVPKGHVPVIPYLGEESDGIIRSHLPNSICITDGSNQVLYTNDIVPGRVYKMSLDGKILARVGTEGRKVGQFGWIHMVACGHGMSENQVLVAEMINMRVQKLTLRPGGATSTRR